MGKSGGPKNKQPAKDIELMTACFAKEYALKNFDPKDVSSKMAAAIDTTHSDDTLLCQKDFKDSMSELLQLVHSKLVELAENIKDVSTTADEDLATGEALQAEKSLQDKENGDNSKLCRMAEDAEG
ncbi:UNVERIFIED_CONTAM: hypothetical protein K2H54_018439 [Gekko kuhli]